MELLFLFLLSAWCFCIDDFAKVQEKSRVWTAGLWQFWSLS